MKQRYKCPCCGALTLKEKQAWYICELCWWEDDPIQYKYLESSGGENNLSLNKWRNKFYENISKFIKEEFYCSLLEKKIDVGLCTDIQCVVNKILVKKAVPEIDEVSRDYCSQHCNNCPLANK